MALLVFRRYISYSVFLLVFFVLPIQSTWNSDGSQIQFFGVNPANSYKKEYCKYNIVSSQHSINRRSLNPNLVKTDEVTKTPPNIAQVQSVNSSTSVPSSVPASGVNLPKTDGNYVTGNATVSNPEDANRTSQTTGSSNTTNSSTSSIPNGSPVMQQGVNESHVSNSTVQENITLVLNKTVVPEGIPATNSSESSESEEADITLNEFKDLTNKTIFDHNITKIFQDHHQFYNSSLISNNEAVGHQYWVDFSKRPDVLVNDMLSQSHRRAATVKLSFDFPFYGHLVRNVTIATGGFLYTGEYVHSWLAATQYIAPLMANFDTSISNDSYVKHLDNGTAFTVQWEKVVLQDKPDSGDFTFQATLHMNGDIVFVYQNVPMLIEQIQDDQHPVKVGLSDAYIIDRTIFFVRRKTIYEYHRLNFDRQDIKNWTVIVLNALPTCVDAKDCESCLTLNTGFVCHWCPSANRCSTGTDRHRQDWLLRVCDKMSLSKVEECPAIPANTSHAYDDTVVNEIEGETNSAAQTDHIHSENHRTIIHDNRNMSISGIIGILFIIAMVASFGIWVLYAYRNPHTASGQLLIRYRPSQWSWKRGETRYTAATIHM